MTHDLARLNERATICAPPFAPAASSGAIVTKSIGTDFEAQSRGPDPSWTHAQLHEWVHAQDWYQTIRLTSQLSTPGRYDSEARLADLRLPMSLRGVSVLDVGCNSGMYCIEAKRRGAERVVGVDLNPKRLRQARHLAHFLELEIEFHELPILDIAQLGTFDLVFCFAVVTEVSDLIGALKALASVTAGTLYLELAPFESARRYRLLPSLLRRLALRLTSPAPVARLRRSGSGWALAPSMDLLRQVIGDEFTFRDLGPSLRYHLVAFDRSAPRALAPSPPTHARNLATDNNA